MHDLTTGTWRAPAPFHRGAISYENLFGYGVEPPAVAPTTVHRIAKHGESVIEPVALDSALRPMDPTRCDSKLRQRHDAILALLVCESPLYIADIASSLSHFRVGVETLRKDMQALVASGLVQTSKERNTTLYEVVA